MSLKLYSYFRSSCSWRVRSALNVLKIPHEIVPINLLNKEQLSPEYRKINPLGTVPAIQTPDGHVIWQSLAIIDYLDQERLLLPKGELERARCWQIVNTICSEIQPLQNLSVLDKVEQLAGLEARKQWAVDHNLRKLKIIENHLLPSLSSKLSAKTSMSEICIVPQLYAAKRFGIDVQKEFPRMVDIVKRVEQLPAFQAAHPHAQSDCPPELKTVGVFM